MKKPLVLAALRRGELKDAAIARRHGVSEGYVRLLRKQCGLPSRARGPRWTAAEIDTLRRLRASGVGYREIGAELGRSPAAVQVAASHFGVSVRRAG